MKSTVSTPISKASPSTPRPNTLSHLITSAQGRQPVITLHPALVHLFSERDAALFLSQCYYLADTVADTDGWFERSHQAWQRDLGLSSEQIRRCLRKCAGLVEVKRMGLPARNFYRVIPEALAQRLSGQPSTDTATPEAEMTSGTVTATVTSKQDLQQPVTEPTPPLVARQTPQHSSYRDLNKDKKHSRDDVATDVPISTETLNAFLAAWNANRGELPEADGLSTSRRSALTLLLADCDGDENKARALLTDATKEVAQDDFWLGKRFGLDVLLAGKVHGKAEAWQSRTKTKTAVISPTVISTLGVGQVVNYRRERYTVESITDRYVDLTDDLNGSVRILRNSDDIRAIKPVVQA